MKKIFPIFIVLVFLFQSLGSYLFVQLHRKEIRKEIRQKMFPSTSSNNWVILRFHRDFFKNPGNDFQWKGKREFEYMGKMYDLIRVEEHGNNEIRFHCIRDDKETLLLTNLHMNIKNQTAGNENGKTTINPVQRVLTLFNSGDLLSEVSLPSSLTEIFDHYFFIVKTGELIPAVPPPRI